MKRIISGILCTVLVVVGTGCTMCQSSLDDDYSAFGGRWQRTDRTYGRVGSKFSDVGYRMTDEGETPTSSTEEDLYPESTPELVSPTQ